MALVTATITVDFTANYAGGHRVCWTIQGSGNPYDCTTIVNCVGGGSTCQAIFTTDVNTTSCDGPIVFEGYVQAVCEDISSLNGRLPFNVNFVPNPICNRHVITCEYTGIGGINIIDGGINFLIGDSVQIIRNVADTQILNAIITISAVGTGIINSVSSIAAAGLGYTALDIIDVDVLAGPGCTGSGAQIQVDSIGGSGEILTYTLINGGTLYSGCPMSFSGGTGAGAVFNIIQGVDFDAIGEVLGFIISNPGEYDIVPTIGILSGLGTSFNGIVLLEDCPTWNDMGLDCSGALVSFANGIPHGEVVAVCVDDSGLGGMPPEYSEIEEGCCIPEDTEVVPICVDYHIENLTGAPQPVQYTGCTGIVFTAVVPNGVTLAVCAIIDGVVDPGISGLDITTSMAACAAI